MPVGRVEEPLERVVAIGRRRPRRLGRQRLPVRFRLPMPPIAPQVRHVGIVVRRRAVPAGRLVAQLADDGLGGERIVPSSP